MKKLLACLAVSTVLLTGCNFGPKGETIIKVNDTAITKSEFNKEFDKAIDSSFFRAMGGAKNFEKSDKNPMYAIFRDKIVNELVIKTLIDQEIAKRGITATKEDIQNELKMIADKVGSMDRLNTTLKERGISNAEFTEDLKTQIKIKKLVDSIQKINISDNDARKYYDTHKSEFVHQEQVRASHILIAASTTGLIQEIKKENPNMSPADLNTAVDKQMSERKAKAEAVLAEVKKNPENFEKIAQKSSDDKGSASRGGDLGFFPKEAMVAEFANAAFSMKPNTVGETLVQTPYGYHIIKVVDRMEAGTVPFDKIKDEIKGYLETQKQIEVIKNLTAGLMKNAKIEYVDESFDPSKAQKQKDPAPVKKDAENK